MTNQSSAISALAVHMPSALLVRAALAQAVSIAFLPVERRNTIPVLSNLLLKGDGGHLAVVGTDLDVEVKVNLDAAADSDFATTIEGAKFRDILAKAKASDECAMDLIEEGRIALDMGGIKFKLQTLPAEDFPSLQVAIYDNSFFHFRIATKDLKTAFECVKFAVSTEETRYYLNGVFMHGGPMADGGHGLQFVATDGHRLAKFETSAIALPIDLPGVILPRKTVDIFLKALWQLSKAKIQPDFVDVEVFNSIDGSIAKVKFIVGHVEIVSKLIDGTFPEYSRVIPNYNDKAATFNCKAFSEAVEQVSLISNEKGRAVRFAFENRTCKFSVHNEGDSAEMTLQGTYSADPLEVGLNSYYVKDFLDQFEGDEFTFVMNDGGSPVIVRDGGEPRLLCVIMPMRI